jgi:hypothetical protein
VNSKVLDKVQQLAFGAFGLGLLGVLVLGFQDPGQFFRSYLFAYLFWLGLSIGCVSILMLQHLTGGLWGLVSRRILEAGSRVLPVMAVLFLPVALGVGTLYVWAGPEPHDHHLAELRHHQAPYLNVPFFLARAVFYFAVWIGLGTLLSRWSLELDKGEDRRVSRRLRSLSGGGLVLMGLTTTFSAFDWGMSLDPRWFSTIYGFIFMVGQVLSAMTLVIIVLSLVGREQPFETVAKPTTIHDLGKLLLAFVMLWSYLHLSQFLIIWSGNLPEEVVFYTRRQVGAWGLIGFLLVLFHFALPFVLLLSRGLKRNLGLMGILAGWLFLFRIVEMFWIIEPVFGETGPVLHLLDLFVPLGLGGAWVAAFVHFFRDRPAVPVGEPEIRELLQGA